VGALADKITRQMLDKIETEMETLGQAIADDLRQLISVPVGRDERGRVTVRSKPGEPPRKDTGRLYESVTHVVYRAGGRVRLVVATNTPYAGFVNRTRPYRKIMNRRWKRRVEIRLAYSVTR